MIMIRVGKFGGSSLASADKIRNCVNIAFQEKLSLVVVSAIGKTTQRLLKIYELALANNQSDLGVSFQELQDHHFAIAQDLKCAPDIYEKLKLLFHEASELTSQMPHHSMNRIESGEILDQLLSIGERLSSEIFASQIPQGHCFDARTVMITDNSYGGSHPFCDILKERAQRFLMPLFEAHPIVVTQGFIGSTSDGATTTLGFEGSDYSAALFAEALGAKEIQIWTDVPGVFSMDPRILDKAHVISTLSYEEMYQLADLGGKVLHPGTLLPAERGHITVWVKSSLDPKAIGTKISASSHTPHIPAVKALSIRPNQTLVTFKNTGYKPKDSFIKNVFSLFDTYKVDLDLLTSAKDSVSIVLDGSSSSWPVKHFLAEKEIWASAYEHVDVLPSFSLIGLVGHNCLHLTTLLPILSTLPYPIRFMNYGAHDSSLALLASEEYTYPIVDFLHQKLCSAKKGVP
jgi:aspartate kinase